MVSDDLMPWQKATATNLGALTELLADGRWWIKRIIAFNATGAAAGFQVHDHASALSDTDPIRVVVPAGDTVVVEGPFRFTLGVQASGPADANSGITLVYRRREAGE